MVMVVRLKDSTLLDFARTDYEGKFNISIPIETVEIIISHHKFDDKYIFLFPSETKMEIDLKDNHLPEKSEMMNEVTIYAYQEPVHFRGDSLVYLQI